MSAGIHKIKHVIIVMQENRSFDTYFGTYPGADGIPMANGTPTDVTWLLFAHHVSWAYYIRTGTQPDCDDDSAEICAPVAQRAITPGIWNPLPLFGDVHADRRASAAPPRPRPDRGRPASAAA